MELHVSAHLMHFRLGDELVLIDKALVGRVDTELAFHLTVAVIDSTLQNLLVHLDNEMPIEAGILSPTLIDAMHGIGTGHLARRGIEGHTAQTLVTVGIHDEIYIACLLVGETEEGRTRSGGHLSLNAVVGQFDTVIGRCGNLLVVTELRATCQRIGDKFAAQRHQGERAIILGHAAHDPMAVAETLYLLVLIIIRRNLLLLGVLGLSHPEVHAMGHEDGGDALPGVVRLVVARHRSLLARRDGLLLTHSAPKAGCIFAVMSTGADHGIDILHVIFLLRLLAACRQHQQQRGDTPFTSIVHVRIVLLDENKGS